jgi:hypothetical protein
VVVPEDNALRAKYWLFSVKNPYKSLPYKRIILPAALGRFSFAGWLKWSDSF